MAASGNDQVIELIDLTMRAANAYDRPDLAVSLVDARERALGPSMRVLVIGEFKQGKSTLVNALLNVEVCPASDDIATVIPTMIRHGDEPGAEAIIKDLDNDQAGSDDETPAPILRRRLELEEIAGLTSEAGDDKSRAGVRMVEVAVPRRLLQSGMALIDTPGVGGLNSVHGAATEGALKLADMVLFVTDASQELSASELTFLRRAANTCDNLVVVLTKIDIYHHWRRILDINRGHLAREGLSFDIVPVSSVLRRLAHEQGSRELNEESGYPALVSRLHEAAETRSSSELDRQAVDEVRFCIDQMEQAFKAEEVILSDPDAAARVIAELETARDRANALRARSAKWQQTLTDGCQDLTGDIDHDLRARVREITSAAEEAIENGDPAKTWSEFAPWLEQRVAAEMALNGENLRTRAEQLAVKVAEHFALDEAAIEHNIDLSIAKREAVEFDPQIDLTVAGVAGSALTAARGAYGGVLMAGLVGSQLGLALLNPFALIIGIGLGRKALREERKRSLLQRQQQAKALARKYIDAVSFEVAKESRDLMRRVQRDLRDEFATRAEQLQASTREALAAAEAAATEQLTRRESRLADVRAELGRLAKLRQSSDTVTATLAGVDR